MLPVTLEGKDAPLEETIDRASSLLEKIGLSLQCSSWLNPVPNCWSVHIQSSLCPDLYTNGKGITREAALASGLGEFFERLSTDFFFAEYSLESRGIDNSTVSFFYQPNELSFNDFSTPSHNRTSGHKVDLLTPSLRDYYNPNGELLVENLLDNNFDRDDRGILALPFRNISTDRPIYFPVSILNNIYVSNGMAAGNSAAEARSQALSEIIERHVKNRVIAGGLALPEIPRSALYQLDHLIQLIEALEREGFIIQVKDASLGGQFPVICVLLVSKENGGIFASFGCNCRFKIALERTLTELLQGRQLKQLRDFSSPCHDMDIVSAPYNLESHFIDSDGILSWRMLKGKSDFPLVNWDFQGSTSQEWARLQNIVNRCGHDINLAEYTHCGIYSCRLVVPGMSEIYPVDDLVWNNRNQGSKVRNQLLRLQKMDTKELKIFDELLSQLGFQESEHVSRLIGVLFDESSPWNSLQIGELKAMIKLALGNYIEAMELCIWCSEFAEMPHEGKRLYQMIHTLLGFLVQGEDLHEYTETLSHLYTTDEIEYSTQIIEGKILFPGLNFADTWADLSGKQSKLLQLYSRIQASKLSGEFSLTGVKPT